MAKFHILICLFILYTCSCSSETTMSGNISWWCGQTPHHQTCHHHLGRHNFSTVALISTSRFLEMMVRASIDDALVVRARVHEIEAKYPNAPGKGSWSSCVHYFDMIVFTLNKILDNTVKPTPLDIQTWLSASLTYIDVCEKGFELVNMTNTILPFVSNNLTRLITNSLAISVLNRDSNNPMFVDWNMRNEYMLWNNLATKRPDVVVAQDGSGNYRTVQHAVNAASKFAKPKSRFVIYVKSGVYTENVMILHTVPYITMYGDGINKTIITSSRSLGGRITDLKSTATFQVWGSEFMAQDMTFRNTVGPDAQQAVAFLSGSDHSTFYHCSFEGYQDTLYAFSNRQFYKECQIFGTVDFIFGNALAVFQDCEIFLRKPRDRGGLVVTAQSRARENEVTGFSLQGCKITAGEDLKPVLNQYNKAFLGRPWRPHALTVYMENYFDDLVDPKGWLDTWGFNKTCFVGEYNNYGPGSSTVQRVKWPSFRKIKDRETAEPYTVAQFFGGDNWVPKTGVPYIPGFENN